MARGGFLAQKFRANAYGKGPEFSLATIAKRRLEALNADKAGTARVWLEYATKPVEFMREVLGYELEIPLPDGTLCTYQADLCRLVARNDRVTVRSGQKTGKSLVAILLAVWWCATRERGHCVLTSSSDPQVKNVLWTELHEVARTLKARSIDILPEVPLDPATGLRWPDGRILRGFATKKPENAAGISGPALFFILDEASGIDTEIADAFVGNTTGGGKVLCLSNPTQTSGFFFDTHTTRSEYWRTVALSCYDSPNYRSGQLLVPGLATRQAVDEMIAAYGEDSPFVAVRVRGDFPRQVANAIIGLGLVSDATARWDDTVADLVNSATLDLGVDVARFGDDCSVICARRAGVAYSPAWISRAFGEPVVVNGADSTVVSGLVMHTIRKMRRPGERVRVKIDAAGGYGGAVADRLREQRVDRDGVEVIEVNVASSSHDESYERLRDALWFGGRTWLQAGGMLAPDPALEHELVMPIYTMAPNGRLRAESKDSLKARSSRRRSPDHADAFLLAIHDTGGEALTQAPPSPMTYDSPLAF